MHTNQLQKNCVVGLFLGIALLGASSALASPLYSGTISANFSNPVLAGNILNPAGMPVFQDNSATAVYSIINSGSMAELFSGDNNGGNGSPSEIVFVGNSFSNVGPNVEFELGTITYSNGTSQIASSLFGATLTLSVQGNPAIISIGTNFGLVTTQNGGISPSLDADFLSFPAPLSVNFHIFEGASGTATVFGTIVGDPELQLTQIQLGADQSGNGFLTTVPEPGSLLLLGVGFVAFLVSRRWKLMGRIQQSNIFSSF